jgi:DNA-binding beta-propeller fold protein YncE
MVPFLSFFGHKISFGQSAPAISYTTPQVLVRNAAAAISPANSGGAVPAGTYRNVTTLAGSTQGFANNTGASAQFNRPVGLTIDADGNVYVADTYNHRIRRVTPDGVVTTIAGDGYEVGFFGRLQNNSTGTSASFNYPTDIAIHPDGSCLYVADKENDVVRRISLTSPFAVTTFAGNGTAGFADHATTGTSAQFNQPEGLFYDNSGSTHYIYVADRTNHRIRRITLSSTAGVTATAGQVTTVAGTGGTTFANGTTGQAVSTATFNQPVQVAVSSNGTTVYIADLGNHRVRMLNLSTNTVTTLAGSGSAGGSDNATGTSATFNQPYGIEIDGAGNLVVSEQSGHRIRRISLASTNAVTTLAGSTSGTTGSNNAIGTSATFNALQGMVFDPVRALLYVSDFSNNRIREIEMSGYELSPSLPAGLSMAAGTGVISGTPTALSSAANYTVTAYNHYGSSSATLNLTIADLPTLTTTAASSITSTGSTTGGNITADGGASVTARGVVWSTTSGPTVALSTKTTDGIGTGSFTSSISGLSLNTTYYVRAYATTAAGTAYGSELSFTTLQVAPSISYPTASYTFATGTAVLAGVTLNNTGGMPDKVQVGTLAGNGNVRPFKDGTGTEATFLRPYGVAVDGSGNLYVSDQSNNRIRKIVISTGEVSTLAGNTVGSGDGTGTGASFALPTGVATDGSGNLYVADYNNHRIRKIVIATGVVSTLAGSTQGFKDDAGTSAQFSYPKGILSDGSGNLYVGDEGNNRIRKIVISTGVVSTLAGRGMSGPFTEGQGTVATFALPGGVATDGNGNLYVADGYNHRIRKIVISTGEVSTLAGNGSNAYTDATGNAASFSYPSGVASDGSGNLYVADEYNHRIRKIVISTGEVSTLAGNSTKGYTDATGNAASFSYPSGVASDGSGNLYVADRLNHRIRVISNYRISPALPDGMSFNRATGAITGTPTTAQAAKVYTVYAQNSGGAVSTQVTIAVGSAPTVVTGAASNVTGTTATLNGTVNPNGGTTTSITIKYSTIQADVDGGNGTSAIVTPSSASGNTVTAVSANITGLTPATTYYFRVSSTSAGTGNGTTKSFTTGPTSPSISYSSSSVSLRLDAAMTPLTLSGGSGVEPMQVTTVAGNGVMSYSDGSAMSAGFNQPNGIGIDGSGNLFVADRMNQRIRKITSAGMVSTFVGSIEGVAEGTGTSAQIREPRRMVVDASGNLYLPTEYRIMKITPSGVVTTWAGATAWPYPLSGSADGTGTNARFSTMEGLAIDASGNIYVADRSNHTIRKITPAGVVTTLAGIADVQGSVNGQGAFATFNSPDDVAVDGAGNIYVVESQEHRIRKITVSGSTATVSTYAGGTAGYQDGNISAAQFEGPAAIAADASGNLYVAEANRVRKISATGMVTTLAGGSFGSADGSGTSAQFILPRGFAFDQDGSLYLADIWNHRVRKLSKFAISPALPAGLTFNAATGQVSGTPTVLSPATTYTVTAANAGGTSTTTFTLEVSSTLLTTDASAITETGATSGGTVDATAYVGATQKGVCWNTTGTPTISDLMTTEGSGTGTFTSTLTGLTPNTTYYLRSYVTVGSTTTYGSQKTFKTNELGTFADITKTFGDAKFSLTAPTAVSTGAFSFASSNTGVASVTPAGEVTIAGAGSSTITATQAAAGAYASATKTLTLTVNKGTPTITLSVPTTTALNQVTGSNTINVSGTSSDGQTVTMSIVSGGASGTLTSTATPGVFTLSNVGSSGIITFEGAVPGNTNMNAATKQAAMDVTLINQVISFTPTSPLTYAAGLTQTLTATGGGSGNAVTFTRESGPGSVAGTTLTVTGPGTIVVKASQAGNGTHNAAPDVTRSIVVTPAAPVVSGFTPTSATQGEVVTITGQYFDNVTAVSFGGTAATSFTVVSSTQITAVVGTGHTGVVSVTTTGGTHTRAGFRYKVTWTGATNAFNSTGNWSGGRVPQTDDDIKFSPTASSDLELDGHKTVGNVNFNGSGRSLKLGAYNLTIKGNLTMPGTITGTGRVIMNGASAQTITGGGDIPDLEIDNTSGVTIDASGNELTVSGTLRSTSGTLTTNGKLRLKSTSTGTARVGVVAGSITGSVIAERYVQQNRNSGGTGRAWRLVSVPVQGSGTLRDFFMNGRAGFDLTVSANRDTETDNSGTPIVGHDHATALAATTAGFDWIGVPNQVSSLRSYVGDAGGGTFLSENVPSLSTTYAAAAQGYMVFTRGDRKLNFPSTNNSGATTFRSTGTLKTGNQSVSVAPASTSKFTLVGNPYMSVLDLAALYASNTTVIEPSFWIWDANMAGTNKQGGYVNVYKSGTQWVTNTGSYINPERIESGMAFFVEPNTTLSASATLTITESHKSSAASAGLSPFSTDQSDDHGRMYVRMERADEQGQRQLIDGVMADFHTSFKTTLGDQSDREKLRNGISRGALWLTTDQKILSSEGLPWPTETKRSIPLYMSGVGDQTLIARVDPRGMRDRYVQAWLKDNVLKRQVEINMNAPTDYDFIGTGSAAWDSTRFEIVYVEAGRPSTGVTLEPDDAAELPSVKLYPNPSKSSDVKLSLRAMAPGTYSVHVLDISGRLVATSTLNHRSVNGEYRILEGRLLSPGTYIIKLSDQNKQPKETLRLVVE